MKSIVTLKNISKKYTVNSQEQVVLEAVNYDFKCAKTTFVLGPSGSGKSSLLNIIAGLDDQYSGEVYYRAKPIDDVDLFRRENVSFIFQDSNLINHHNLLKNITIGLNNGVKNKEKLALSLLAKVGLAGFANKKPTQLSSGERQRVSIARALARNTDILVCDEPTGSLDEKTKIEIIELILKVFKDKSIIIVSHDEDLAKRYGDEIITIEDNKIKVLKAAQASGVMLQNNARQDAKTANENSFNHRFYINILTHKTKLFNSIYLLIVIAAIAMFTAGNFKAVNVGIDQYLYNTYKADKIVVENVAMSLQAIKQYVSEYNSLYDKKITGVSVSLPAQIILNDQFGNHAVVINLMQRQNESVFSEDIVVGHFPKNSNEILFSKAAAIELIYSIKTQNMPAEAPARSEIFDSLRDISTEELFNQLNALSISYKNPSQFSKTKFYDADLTIVGLIDDLRYGKKLNAKMMHEMNRGNHQMDMQTLIAMFKKYGVSVNYPIYRGQSEFSDAIYLNANIYLLEDQFNDFLKGVYLSAKGFKFRYFSVFIDESLQTRAQVHRNFLLFKSIFKGKDAISNERQGYLDDIYGYKLSIVFTLLILGAFAIISTYNGIKRLIIDSRKNIGIYRSLGYTTGNIRAMFIKEGLLIAVFSAFIALLFSLLISFTLGQAFVNMLDPSRIVSLTSQVNFDVCSLLMTALTVVAVVVIAINGELKKTNIDNLLR